MTGRRIDARGVVLEMLDQLGAGPDPASGIEPALEIALDGLTAAVGARVGAVYIDDRVSRGLALRCRRPEAGAGEDDIAPEIGARRTPALIAALRAGLDVDDQSAAGPELVLVGLGDGLMVPSRFAGSTVGAVGVAFAEGYRPTGEDRATVRAVAQILALWVRNGQLISGLRDRVRELDRQALQLAALTQIARRVAGTLDEGEAHRVIVTEARALVLADSATLAMPDGHGGMVVVAHDGVEAVDEPLPDLTALAASGGATRDERRVTVVLPRSEAGRAAPDDGAIIVRRARGAPFDEDDLERLRGLADQASVALANARLLTDLRGEQETRRALAAAIVLAQEQERRRVAESLHDGPVQELVGVGLMLDALSNDLDLDSPAAAADVDRAAAAAREAVRGLRRAISDLHPLALEELGFAAATRSLMERLEWRGVQVELDLADADALSETQRAVAFRIVQEAVANIMRHADPTRVTISAHTHEGAVVIEVTDDGRGFDPDRPRAGVAEGHLGLAAVEERAALAGGELTIVSSEGRGTTIRLALPAES